MSTLLNKPYDAFADEGAEDEVAVEVKAKPQSESCRLLLWAVAVSACGGRDLDVWWRMLHALHKGRRLSAVMPA